MIGTTLVAAFAVGLLVGDRHCSTGPETRVEEKIVEREVPVPSPDVCACGTEEPDTGPAETGPPVEPRNPARKPEKKLPDAPGPPDPTARRKLLAWVRDQSSRLQPCRSDSLTETRFAVTFELDENGAIGDVAINAPEEEVSGGVLRCLRRRMSEWTPPGELVEGRSKLVFGLKL